MTRYLVLDFETRSEVDLKRTGAWEYSADPTTKILCVAWKVGNMKEIVKAETKVWSPAIPSPYGELIRNLLDPNVILVAHNAYFEQVIVRNVLSRIVSKPGLKSIPSSRWICTASLARALALPGNLQGAGDALGLKVQKDMIGHKLMMKMSKPRRARKGEDPKRVYWHQKKKDLLRLMQYCATDTDVEAKLLSILPPLCPTERKVWELDQKINMRGFSVDRELALHALALIDEEVNALKIETAEITKDEITSTNQRAKMIEWLKGQKIWLPNLQAKTVADFLKDHKEISPGIRLLQIRQAISKSSTAKFEAYDLRSRSDGRLRDHTLYHVASTGRFGGTGLQPHNFPQGKIKNTEPLAEVIKEGDLENLRLLYGDPMSAMSSCLRGGIIASPGKELFCADFASIEVRVLFWIAHHKDGIKAYEEDQKIYEIMAGEIFNRDWKKIEDPSPERDLGKRAILGGGFGMGWKKFMATCEQYNQPVSEELAKRAISAYRELHAPVVQLWYNLERAAIKAVKNPNKEIKVNRVTWIYDKKILWCVLPSGRKLAYYNPVIKYEPTPWEEMRPKLYHWDINPKTKAWELSATYGGKLTENVVQAIARDLMVEAMLREEKALYEILITVHDELLAERNKGQGSVKEFESLMASLPVWAKGCPVKAKGWSGSRYRK